MASAAAAELAPPAFVRPRAPLKKAFDEEEIESCRPLLLKSRIFLTLRARGSPTHAPFRSIEKKYCCTTILGKSHT